MEIKRSARTYRYISPFELDAIKKALSDEEAFEVIDGLASSNLQSLLDEVAGEQNGELGKTFEEGDTHANDD